MMPQVLLVRHALSAWNLHGRWQGQADPPLSAEGEAQARAGAASVGHVDLVLSSDLARARRTACLLAPGREVVEVAGLRELDVGAWSGLTRAEIETVWPGLLERFDAGELAAAPGGEGRGGFEARVAAGWSEVGRRVAAAGANRVLVVAHGGVIRALARLQGVRERHVAHLTGYLAEAEDKEAALVLRHPICLLGQAAESPAPGGEMAL
jgi:probable phosphoglycerate mutase